MNWQKIAYILYPLIIAFLLPLLFYLSVLNERDVSAGIIRKATLSSEQPLVVRLAMGRSTAISFPVKPEKVVPGSPQAVEINFLNRDLAIRPLSRNPGNLIVYTKSNRYVILLQVVSDHAYDDAVAINSFSSYARPIQLGRDTFSIEEVKLKDGIAKKETSITALVKIEGKVLESDFLPEGMKCRGCIMKKRQDQSELTCQKPIQSLECEIHGKRTLLIRSQPTQEVPKEIKDAR